MEPREHVVEVAAFTLWSRGPGAELTLRETTVIKREAIVALREWKTTQTTHN